MLVQDRSQPAQQHGAATATPTPDAVAVEARDLYKAYGPKVAVDGVSFAVRAGEIFGILGPNGAGKSTTLELLEGLRDPDRGAAFIGGLEVRRNKRAVHARIGVQLQSTALFEQLSVADNLRLLGALYARSLPVAELLAAVALTDRATALLGTLSGGQRQRVALAATLVNDPQVVFLDEPTTGLDPQARRALWAIVQGLRERGKTIVLTTHYMQEAEVLCDRIAIMEGGRIVAIDTPARLVARHGGGLVIRCRFAGVMDRADLVALPGIAAVSGPDGATGRFTFRADELDRALFGLLNHAERSGATVLDLQVQQPGLEDVFLQLTGRALRDE